MKDELDKPERRRPYRRRTGDPRKRVSAVAVGVESDEIRVMFIIDGEPHIITERPGLTREQAELIAAGMANGLRAAALGYYLDEPDPDGNPPA